MADLKESTIFKISKMKRVRHIGKRRKQDGAQISVKCLAGPKQVGWESAV